MQQFDPWKVLGVGRDATQEEIKAAFKKHAKETHPDTHPGLDADEFIRVQEAYDAMMDARVAENAGDEDSAVEHWCRVFGDAFRELSKDEED